MQIHRSLHTRGFTVLPNTLLRDRRLSYTARGLLVDLLSRPDDWSEDGRRMADTSPQGRRAVAKALRELTEFGYYRVDKPRRDDGTIVSEAHLYDVPQPVPDVTLPGSGEAAPEVPGSKPTKNRDEEPTLPAQRSAAAAEAGRGRKPPPSEPEPAASDDALTGQAAAVLFRVLRPEPRLRLGTTEALALAPLVVPWLERGYDDRDLANALLPGLPAYLRSAPALIRDRLTRKLPPPPEPPAPPAPRRHECGTCARPIPTPGICRTCAGLGAPAAHTDTRAQVAIRGRARVRAALLAARTEQPASGAPAGLPA